MNGNILRTYTYSCRFFWHIIHNTTTTVVIFSRHFWTIGITSTRIFHRSLPENTHCTFFSRSYCPDEGPTAAARTAYGNVTPTDVEWISNPAVPATEQRHRTTRHMHITKESNVTAYNPRFCPSHPSNTRLWLSSTNIRKTTKLKLKKKTFSSVLKTRSRSWPESPWCRTAPRVPTGNGRKETSRKTSPFISNHALASRGSSCVLLLYPGHTNCFWTAGMELFFFFAVTGRYDEGLKREVERGG